MKTWLRRHMIYWVGSSHSSYHPATFVGLAPCESKHENVWFVTRPIDRSVTWLCGWVPFTLSHHSAKFDFHRPWESGDITPLICHVTTCLMCHVTCGWNSLILSHLPAKFGVHMSCESGHITLFICHVTTTSKFPPILSHFHAKFGVHRPYGTGNNDVCNIRSNSNSISNTNSNTEVYKWSYFILFDHVENKVNKITQLTNPC